MSEIQSTNYSRKRLIVKLMTRGLESPDGSIFSIKKSYVFVKWGWKRTFAIFENDRFLGEVFCSDFFKSDPYLIGNKITISVWNRYIIFKKILMENL